MIFFNRVVEDIFAWICLMTKASSSFVRRPSTIINLDCRAAFLNWLLSVLLFELPIGLFISHITPFITISAVFVLYPSIGRKNSTTQPYCLANIQATSISCRSGGG